MSRRVPGQLLNVFAIVLVAVISLVAASLSAFPATASPARPGQADAPGTPTAATQSGRVSGARSGGVDSFLGIPYAAAPVGARRWTSPRPPTQWTGVRSATAYGARCAALKSNNGPRFTAEDCLFVNVQRPAGAKPGDRLPVYVFLHGGGLANGSSNQFDMATIVRTTGVIGVTLNYRLGVFGFLSHPGFTGASGNYGFADQQAALRWVRRNIAAFGGSPSAVTLGGDSAGGWSVCGHLVAPGSRGLFARAMIQSGSCATKTVAQADDAGTTFAALAGCADVRCLRAKSAAALLDASATFDPRLVRGTRILPVDPAAAVRTGRFARVPILIGGNADEGRTFTLGSIGWGESEYTSWLQRTFAGWASAVQARYPWPANATTFTAAYLIGAILTDSALLGGIGGCGNRDLIRQLSRYTDTYAYQFAHRTGPGLTPITGYVWGAGHAAELAYLWPSFDNGTPIAPTFTPAERRLSAEMVRYWGAFARIGAPRVPGQLDWPRYDQARQILSLRAGGHSTVLSDASFVAAHQCAFWRTVPVSES